MDSTVLHRKDHALRREGEGTRSAVRGDACPRPKRQQNRFVKNVASLLILRNRPCYVAAP
jgi:hypothetical protein